MSTVKRATSDISFLAVVAVSARTRWQTLLFHNNTTTVLPPCTGDRLVVVVVVVIVVVVVVVVVFSLQHTQLHVVSPAKPSRRGDAGRPDHLGQCSPALARRESCAVEIVYVSDVIFRSIPPRSPHAHALTPRHSVHSCSLVPCSDEECVRETCHHRTREEGNSFSAR
jgi:hypothetical protein